MFCGTKSYTARVPTLSFGIDTAPQLFCHSFVAPSMIWYVVRR